MDISIMVLVFILAVFFGMPGVVIGVLLAIVIAD